MTICGTRKLQSKQRYPFRIHSISIGHFNYRLLRYSGLIKPKTDSVQSSSDKPAQPIKSKNTKKLLEILKEAENDICSDETNSDVSFYEFLYKLNLLKFNDSIYQSVSRKQLLNYSVCVQIVADFSNRNQLSFLFQSISQLQLFTVLLIITCGFQICSDISNIFICKSVKY